MRTTLDIRQEALELARLRARESGMSLGEVVSEASLAALGDTPPDQQGKNRITLPAGGARGLQAGVSLDDSAALRDRMDGVG